MDVNKMRVGDIIKSQAFARLENGNGDADYLIISRITWGTGYDGSVVFKARELPEDGFKLSAPTITFRVGTGPNSATTDDTVDPQQIRSIGHTDVVMVPESQLPDYMRG